MFVIDCTTMGWADPMGTPPTTAVDGLSSRYGGQMCLRVMNLKANSLAWAVHVNRQHSLPAHHGAQMADTPDRPETPDEPETPASSGSS